MRVLFFLLFFHYFSSLAQVLDNFKDGNFNVNPSWLGDTTQFTVSNAGQLQLNSLGTGVSFLSTRSSLGIHTEWNFWVKLSFSPSDNNLSKIYLMSDNPDLKGPLKGYFIRLGENGSSDGIDLWSQNGSTESKLIDGISGHCAQSTNTLRIKVIHDKYGNWNLFSDTTGGNNFNPEGNAFDTSFAQSAYFGIYCKYTSSNVSKFYFDDFHVNTIISDTTGPEVLNIEVLSDSTIDVHFSEAIEAVAAANTANYAINFIVHPSAMDLDAGNKSLVHLTFPIKFLQAIPYSLSTKNIADLSGNKSLPAVDTFFYYIPKANDIVINEIMADPTPQVNLPAYEYIELYNASDFPIRLKGWKFTAGSASRTFPDITILADSFLVVTDVAAKGHFKSGIKVTGIPGFPALTNTGSTLVLRTANGNIVSAVSFSDTWYQHEVKKEGGWSLEQVDPLNPCAEHSNWKASEHHSGGSPGEKNAVAASNPDTQRPEISRISILSEDSIQVHFNERVDSLSVFDPGIYHIDNTIGYPVTVDPVEPGYESIRLFLPQKIKPGIIYNLSITKSITDCSGNKSTSGQSVPFAIPEPATPSDVVINEILFEPYSQGTDFVEIYNRSDKIIDLSTLNLGKMDSLSGTISDSKPIVSASFNLFPKTYLVLSRDFNAVKRFYYTPFPSAHIDMTALPSLDTESGVIVLLTQTGTLIDKVHYRKNMHFPLLNSSKGVSLERINPDRASGDITNWHSAAQQAGFATPAFQNSQFSDTPQKGFISITPEVFSPNNDGYNDIINIHYTFAPAGNVGSITIFDAQGIEVKKLVTNQLLGAEGSYSWDGIDENKMKASVGAYIVLFEIFDLKGNVKTFKRVCVLAEKL